jgi:hypothetical protein
VPNRIQPRPCLHRLSAILDVALDAQLNKKTNKRTWKGGGEEGGIRYAASAKLLNSFVLRIILKSFDISLFERKEEVYIIYIGIFKML